MNSKKILITGASGFIGSALAIELEKLNYNIKCISLQSIFTNKSTRPKINFAELLSEVSCIVHCAAKHSAGKENKNKLFFYRKSNVELTRNLAKQAAFFGVKRFIFLSSIGVNGDFTEKSKKFKNDDVPKPTGNYQVSKWEAEQELLKISKQTGLDTVIIRSPLVYGKGVKGNFLKLLKLIYYNAPLPLQSINNKRSYIYIENLINFIIKCIEYPKFLGKTLLVSDGVDLSTPDLLRKISKIMKKSPKIFSMPIPIIYLIAILLGKKNLFIKLVKSLRVDNSKSCKILKWRPIISFKDGLEKTVYWYLNNR